MLELAEARRLADAEAAPPAGCARLDEGTIEDLDLGLVFQTIDRTVTPSGAQALWRWLAAPALDRAVLEARERTLERFADDGLRERVRRLLRRGATATTAAYLPRLLWEPLVMPPRARWFVAIVGVLLALIGAAVLWPHGGWVFGAGVLFAANVLLDDWLNLRLAQQARGLEVLGQLLATAHGLVRRRVLPRELADELAAELAPLAALRKRIVVLAVNDPFELASVVRAGLLIRLITLARCLHLVEQHRERLRRVVLWMGELDALAAVATLRAEHARVQVPELVADRAAGIVARDLVHPAVAGAIGNDLALRDAQPSLLVTGSNMSGKSTFLRAIGITAVLAQSIHTTFGSWRAPLVRVFAAMRIADDTRTGTSQYAAEVEAIGRLVATVGEDAPALFVVDEPFRGTNPGIRVPIVVHVLDYLAARDIVVAATHDLEVAARVSPRFWRGYFCELSDQTFDRKLRAGVARSHNAVALLARAGYPPEVVRAIAVNIRNGASSKAPP